MTNYQCGVCLTQFPSGVGLGLELAAQSDDVGTGDAPIAVAKKSCPNCGAGFDGFTTY
jgi:hypothetical protein